VIPTKEGLLSTIRALLEMTEARGCTKAEAAVARNKALNLMRKYGVSVEDLATRSSPVAPPKVAPSTTPETDFGRRAAHEYWSVNDVYSSDGFVREDFSRKSPQGWRARADAVARKIAGYAIAGFAVWIIAMGVGQEGTGYQSNTAAPTASQPQSADAVSSFPSVQLHIPSATSAPSPHDMIQGVYQKLYKGWWVKFAVGQDGKVVGTPIYAYTRWLNVPMWKD
jgi:hypothetical protein